MHTRKKLKFFQRGVANALYTCKDVYERGAVPPLRSPRDEKVCRKNIIYRELSEEAIYMLRFVSFPFKSKNEKVLSFVVLH